MTLAILAVVVAVAVTVLVVLTILFLIVLSYLTWRLYPLWQRSRRPMIADCPLFQPPHPTADHQTTVRPPPYRPARTIVRSMTHV